MIADGWPRDGKRTVLVLEDQNESKLRRQLGERYIDDEKLPAIGRPWGGAYIRGTLHIFENKPPLKGGLIREGYGIMM